MSQEVSTGTERKGVDHVVAAEPIYLPQTEDRRSRHKVPSLRELAQQDTEWAYNQIKEIAAGPPSKLSLMAAIEILNRGHGHAPREITINEPLEKEELKLRRQALRLFSQDPEHLKKVLAIAQQAGLLRDPNEPIVEPVQVAVMIEDAPQNDSSRALIEATPKEEREEPCFCGHDRAIHPAGGGCVKYGCRCLLFSDPDEAEAARAHTENGY